MGICFGVYGKKIKHYKEKGIIPAMQNNNKNNNVSLQTGMSTQNTAIVTRVNSQFGNNKEIMQGEQTEGNQVIQVQCNKQESQGYCNDNVNVNGNGSNNNNNGKDVNDDDNIIEEHNVIILEQCSNNDDGDNISNNSDDTIKETNNIASIYNEHLPHNISIDINDNNDVTILTNINMQPQPHPNNNNNNDTSLELEIDDERFIDRKDPSSSINQPLPQPQLNPNLFIDNSTALSHPSQQISTLTSLNRNMRNLINFTKPKEQTDFFDWSYNYKTNLWKNHGQITLTKEKLTEIISYTLNEIKEKKFYIKRIWFNNYINSNIYDNSNDNIPLVISRNNILIESFNQFMTTKELNLHTNLQIHFIDEIAYDIGGVYREWYYCLFKEIFNTNNNFFTLITTSTYNNANTNTYYIPISNPLLNITEHLLYYKFIGKIIGKALFDKITMGINLNRIILKHLMGYALNEFNLDDLKYYDISIYNSLSYLLKENINEDLDLYFVWEIEKKEYELIPNGNNIRIDNNNKYQFIQKVIEFICYNAVKDKITALLEGFNEILMFKTNKNIFKVFTIEEFDFMLSGQHVIDINDWERHTVYKGIYHKEYKTIKHFWEILRELNEDELFLFFKFCTGCSRVPVDGFCSLQGTRNQNKQFCIEPVADLNKQHYLIEATTCFNTIHLPDYKDKEVMKRSILAIVNNNTDFFGMK